MKNPKQTRTKEKFVFSAKELTKEIQRILQHEFVGLIEDRQGSLTIRFLDGRRFRLEITEEEQTKSLLD